MSELVVEQHGAVAVLRLNRPDARNALTPSLLGALVDAVTAAESSDEVRAVVLTGTGDRAFCAGMDLRAGSGPLPPDVLVGFDRLMAGEATVPLVGAANATAVGGGLELLLACDVVVASEAAAFGLPEVQRGLFPAGNGTAIGRRVGHGVAMELLLTGDRIDAARAREVGLVNHVVPADDVLPTALAVASRIAANGPLSLQAVKELGRLAATGDTAEWAARRDHWRSVVFSSADAAEGAAAFVERRDPVWRGQ